MKHVLFACALLGAPVACLAQTASPTTYEFLTLVEVESQFGKLAKLTFAPSFQGKTQLPLEELPNSGAEKFALTYQRNLVTVNQQLEALTAAGWELVSVAASTPYNTGHEYLFRRRKP